MKTVITLALFIVTFNTAIAEVSSFEKQALIDLYHATNGDHWNESWDLSTSIKNWKGVTIIDDKVVALQLTNNNLNGELPTSIGNLTNLKVLNLHNNNIKGNIPTSVGYLNNLILLNISLNTFSGNIPKEISKIESLEHFDIYANDFTGSLPTEISQLQNLKRIRMYATHLNANTLHTLAITY